MLRGKFPPEMEWPAGLLPSQAACHNAVEMKCRLTVLLLHFLTSETVINAAFLKAIGRRPDNIVKGALFVVEMRKSRLQSPKASPGRAGGKDPCCA